MEYVAIPGTTLSPSRIGLGTWAVGGWMWGGTDEERSIRTICAALDRGVTLIDTAPAYGQGRSEEIVGKAVAVGDAATTWCWRPRSGSSGEQRRRHPKRQSRADHEGDRGLAPAAPH